MGIEKKDEEEEEERKKRKRGKPDKRFMIKFLFRNELGINHGKDFIFWICLFIESRYWESPAETSKVLFNFNMYEFLYSI